jgi:hypothetical protein
MILLKLNGLKPSILLHRYWIGKKIIDHLGVNIVIAIAIHDDDINIFKLLHKMKIQYVLDTNVLIYNHCLSLIKYVHSTGTPFDETSMVAASVSGSPEIVEYLHHIGLECTIEAITRIQMVNGSLMLLYKLRAKDIFGDSNIDYIERNLVKIQSLYQDIVYFAEFLMRDACSEGDLEFVQFLHTIGINLTDIALNSACQCGHSDIVKYLYDNGISIQSDDIDSAIMDGHIDVVKFILDIGNVDCTAEAIIIAIEDNLIDIIHLLYNYSNKYMDDTMELAIEEGRIDIVEFLYKMNIRIPDNAMYLACEWNHLELAKWLHGIGIELYDNNMDIAIENGNYEIIEFLYKNGLELTKDDMDGSDDSDLDEFLNNIGIS